VVKTAGTEKRRSTEQRNTITIGVAVNLDSIFDWREVGAQVKAVMGWRRGQALDQDLRDRVLAHPEATLAVVAERFGVSKSYVSKARARLRHLGQSTPGLHATTCRSGSSRCAMP
jgi:hypothetical protein